MQAIRKLVIVTLLGLSSVAALASGQRAKLCVSGAADADLCQALERAKWPVTRFDSPSEAVANAAPNSGVLVLADKYPTHRTQIDLQTWSAARSKNLRLYIEFPSVVPGLTIGDVRKTTWERVVVAFDTFGPRLAALRILALHDCHFTPITGVVPLLAVARVAGFDCAVYGLPTNSFPILFRLGDEPTFIATTRLSQFQRGRYAPAEDWQTVWTFILSQIDPENSKTRTLRWEPLVRPAFGPGEKLPAEIERKTFNRAAAWIENSRLLIPASRESAIAQALLANSEEVPLSPVDQTVADGSFGILEGYASGILHDGTQPQRLPIRADCNTESAMVLALDSALNHRKKSGRVAANLLDYVFVKSDMCQGPRGDPNHAAFGHIGWGAIAPAWRVANYGDDNARAILATIICAVSLESTNWNAALAKALLANFRTTGKHGFRGDRIDVPDLERHGWQHYYNAETISTAPHFESGLWACYLWAYRQTGFTPFLEKTRKAIAMTMKAYPSGWRWGDNIERSRMLLCLAWLVRVDDKPEHRQWLKQVASDLLDRQSETGSIHEWISGTGGGHFQIPQSNEAYGTGETPLIQQNGDPASDQLYTTGFALLGLHEAVAATDDQELRKAGDRLAEFLCRIQIRSAKMPWLDGWWFRAFDDRRWEYWSSSADVGWGAWSLEAGWAQAWTATTLALRQQKMSMWDFISKCEIAAEFRKWKEVMLESSAPTENKDK